MGEARIKLPPKGVNVQSIKSSAVINSHDYWKYWIMRTIAINQNSDHILLRNRKWNPLQKKYQLEVKTVRLPHSSFIAVDVWSEAAIADCTPVTAI